MRVIKDKDKTFTCENCGCIVELEHSREVNWEYGYIYLECPVCGKQNYIQDDPFDFE